MLLIEKCPWVGDSEPSADAGLLVTDGVAGDMEISEKSPLSSSYLLTGDIIFL